MNILVLLKAVLSIVDFLAKYAHDKQLLQAGEYKAVAEANEKALNNIRSALDARRSPGVPFDQDPNNRDN